MEKKFIFNYSICLIVLIIAEYVCVYDKEAPVVKPFTQ